MDTSETYIKMCEKAEEIQELKIRNQRGSYSMDRGIYDSWDECYYAIPLEVHPSLGGGIRYDIYLYQAFHHIHLPQNLIYYDSYMDEAIWLPRQDQLQEMVIYGTLNKDGLGSLLSRFWVFCSCKYMEEPTFWVFTSMEQLWLVFVMKEKYNKVWDGEEWKVWEN